jgi:two-component system, NarL family, response regulator NreC
VERRKVTIRIVIADDHAILRAGLRSLLAAQDDMEVVGEAVDGRDAVQKAVDMQPDVLLLDLSMPNEGGLATLRAVRDRCPHTRILVLTMHDDRAYLRSVLEAGGAGYLVKRAADTELLTALRTVHSGGSYVDVSLGSELLQEVLGDPPEAPAPEVLSARERQVLELVAMGHTHKEIATALSVSVKTVETYRLRLGEKLGLRSRAELVRYAIDLGLLQPDPAPHA